MSISHALGRLRSPLLGVLLVGLACLLPFLDKPFHIDDPLFLWAARHIQSDPTNFYDFKVNWYGAAMRMSDVTQNPPVTCYYLALATAVVGWGEPALHAAFLLPALAALWGTYRLAELFGNRPALAALAALSTPVFLVSSTSVMCDVMMLAFWVWTVVWWERGLRRQSSGLLYVAGVLIGVCALTKYFGMCLIPLLATYSLADRQPWRRWLGPLLVPVLILGAYHGLTKSLYGHSLLSNAASYATEAREWGLITHGKALLSALAFLGGCVACVAFFLPWLFSWRSLVALAAAGVLPLGLALSDVSKLPGHHGLVLAQLFLWGTLGFAVLALAAADLWTRRDPSSVLLFLWVLGTFVFAGYVNWTINGRSILPLVPAVAVLMTRRMAAHRPGGGPRWLFLALLPAAALALLVTWADYTQAWAARRTAERVAAAAEDDPGTHWFQGHWGFQYYLQQKGWYPWDALHLEDKPGDLLALPLNNADVMTDDLKLKEALLENQVCEWGLYETQPCPWLSTMQGHVGAGFYACVYGPLPFAVGRVPPEKCVVIIILVPYSEDHNSSSPTTDNPSGGKGTASLP
jgi:4-amino-4-deoxy-L-arabinose transferase-like glycosyltransferase